MGRRPNQLILEFFNRGPKLEDASNRYQHTCKACGERFPKGRIDSLTNHLVKKCTALPVNMRQSVLLRLHELPELPGTTDHNKAGNTTTGAEKGKGAAGSFGPRPGFNGLNGLNVLAEASRQVGASETKGHPGQQQQQQQQQVAQHQDQIVLDPALENEGLAQLIQQGQLPNAPPSTATGQQVNKASSPNAQAALPTLAPAPTEPSQLSLIAASANEMVQPTEAQANPGDANGQPGQRLNWQTPHVTLPEDLALIEHLGEHADSPANPAQRAANYPRPIAMNLNSQTAHAFMNNFKDSAPSPKPKVRGRFTASRRKEVQEVRKQGACIRCRMLKKPCSGETPCFTCRNVESARLWKTPCIRTRIADEFPLWQAGLHGSLAFVDINSAKGRLKFAKLTGCMEVTHADDADETCTVVSFAALEAHGQISGQMPSQVDPALELNGENNFENITVGPRILDGETDDLVGKLELYMKDMAATFIERELSGFWKITLTTALRARGEKVDSLLGKTIELWVATQILVDPDMVWKVFANPSQPPAPTPTFSTNPLASMAGAYARTPIDQFSDAESFALIQMQLRSAAEKRSAVNGKAVMNELERRLLQRQQSGSFETFLVALILLNCVERTCWLFKTWENAGPEVRPWPLDRTPAEFAERGERFAEILHMLLKMRGVPPKTTYRPDTGILAAAETQKDEAANKWFEALSLPLHMLQQRANAEFDPANARSYDLRFGWPLLQPVTNWEGPRSERQREGQQ